MPEGQGGSGRLGQEWRRRRMGIEPTARFRRATGFEDQGSHQTPIASTASGWHGRGPLATLDSANPAPNGHWMTETPPPASIAPTTAAWANPAART